MEVRAISSLATLFALRMLGLFMILPVFALYGGNYQGASAALIGLAIGAYGATQALFQVPFGWASDRFGRKPVIAFGLVLFLIGSVLAALSDSIYGVIAGRLLQGAGAIASAVMALLSDLTRDEQRTKAMASVGASIGVSFGIALLLGPMIAGMAGMAGLFWVTALLALIGLGVLYWRVPTPHVASRHMEHRPVLGQFRRVLAQAELLRLNLGVFVLHLSLTASFVVLPVFLVDVHAFPVERHWQLYLPVLTGSFVLMVPLMILAEARRQIRAVFLLAIALLASALLALAFWRTTFWQVALGLFVFFWAFNLLEATLPSLVSKLAPAGGKGTSMGIYSTCQFLGAFAGGAIGGYLNGVYGTTWVLAFSGALALIWLGLAFRMRQPRFLHSCRIELAEQPLREPERLMGRILAVAGVEEAVVILEEKAAYLKIDRQRFDPGSLQAITAPQSGDGASQPTAS